MILQFLDMTSSSHFFDVALFLLSSLVTGSSFMSISSLVLELWQFSFIRDWPEIRKSEIPPSEFRDTKFDTKISNKILRNATKCQGYSFFHFWVVRRKLTGGIKLPPPPPNQIRIKRTDKKNPQEHNETTPKKLLIKYTLTSFKNSIFEWRF